MLSLGIAAEEALAGNAKVVVLMPDEPGPCRVIDLEGASGALVLTGLHDGSNAKSASLFPPEGFAETLLREIKGGHRGWKPPRRDEFLASPFSDGLIVRDREFIRPFEAVTRSPMPVRRAHGTKRRGTISPATAARPDAPKRKPPTRRKRRP